MLDSTTVDIVRNALVYASEEMGIALRNSSYSPNIRERMDHSTAIFDKHGQLLAQAEHIPVHLGSLPWGLVKTIEYCKEKDIAVQPGSMIMVNNPYIAGTHLNDITLIRPIYFAGKLVAYVANKAHHSDVGGKVPGSISIDARTLFEEGNIVFPVYLVKRNHILKPIVHDFSTKSRTPRERAGDLKAQTAANYTGEKSVLALVRKYGVETFQNMCEKSIAWTERLAKKRLRKIPQGTYRAQDYVESPTGENVVLKVKVIVSHKKGVSIDYSGTAREVSYPLNAVYGVTLSGVYYVIRTLIGDDVPANNGCFNPISVHIPEGTILNPRFPSPVAGGNLETSQRNADVLYQAFSHAIPNNVPADSGGSMNNVMMGGSWKNQLWAFYETIGVGLGGRSWNDGIDGIQANMTNTMNTPIEEMERSYPLLIEQYELRPNSGGKGQYRGGTGIIRSYRALTDEVTVTILADRQRNKAHGLFKGAPGQGTCVSLIQKNGVRKSLPSKTTFTLMKDEIVEICTAGGGGYGDPRNRSMVRIKSDRENELINSHNYFS